MMKYRDIIFVIAAGLSSSASAAFNMSDIEKYLPPDISKQKLQQGPVGNQTCALWQTCKGRTGIFGRPMDTTTCRVDGGAPQADDILYPEIKFYEPHQIYKLPQRQQLKKNCPFLDPDASLCCNDDQAEILDANFIQIDTVFGIDCPICAMNIKRMWCEYTCNPNKASFVKGIKYQQDPDPNIGQETVVKFSIDPDYACTMFQSCQKVSLIAQASLQSSEAFLDFMGFNGKQQSHSVIQFDLTKGPNSLNQPAYDCNTIIPSNGSFANFTGVGNCSCAACDRACPAPPVDASIGFFDGFDGALVGIVYGILVAFSIVFQLVRYTILKKYNQNSDDVDLDEPLDSNQADNPYLNKRHRGTHKDKINNSEISSAANNSQLIAAANLRGVDTTPNRNNNYNN